MTNKNIQFLGSELKEEENGRESSKFQIIPCPMEKTVSYARGTAGGPAAIIEASQELERSNICSAGIFTQEAINCSMDHVDCLQKLKKCVSSIIRKNQFPFTLGGEHSLTWATVSGISDVLGEKVGIIQIDAHADLRKKYQGDAHSHASVMNLLVESGHRLASIGVRAMCQQERDFRKERIIPREGMSVP